MADDLTQAQRHYCMSQIKSRDTKPEMLVRRLLYSMGFRYRLHNRNLPGTPDIVFSSRKKVIFVHGCFWHQHKGCRCFGTPKSNRNYWSPKLERNVNRDKRNKAALRTLGWKVLVIWECEVYKKDVEGLAKLIIKFLK